MSEIIFRRLAYRRHFPLYCLRIAAIPPRRNHHGAPGSSGKRFGCLNLHFAAFRQPPRRSVAAAATTVTVTAAKAKAAAAAAAAAKAKANPTDTDHLQQQHQNNGPYRRPELLTSETTLRRASSSSSTTTATSQFKYFPYSIISFTSSSSSSSSSHQFGRLITSTHQQCLIDFDDYYCHHSTTLLDPRPRFEWTKKISIFAVLGRRPSRNRKSQSIINFAQRRFESTETNGKQSAKQPKSSRANMSSSSSISKIRQNYHAETEAAVNRQINLELYAAYVYQQMAFHFNRDDVALSGFEKFFHQSSLEERDHAERLMKFQNLRGGRIVLQDIPKPIKQDWHSCLEAMEAALELEKTVNQSLLELHEIGQKHRDAHFCDFIESHYLDEQARAVKKLSDFVTNLRRIGPGLGEYIFDKETLQS